MKPILTVEFSAKAGDYQFKEESIVIHNTEEFFAFVSPGGGCEKIPDEVEEIRVVFLPVEHKNPHNPIADLPTILQLHQIIFTGPLSEISQTAEQMLDRAGRGELSAAFCRVIGLAT